jgi:hypothetical protein
MHPADQFCETMSEAMPDYCAPGVEGKESCLTLPYLRLIARLWNAQRPHGTQAIKLSSSKEELIAALEAKTHRAEREFARLSFVPNPVRSVLDQAYRPQRPARWSSNKYEWLRTDDIANVMVQYEKRYPTFKFVGVFPIDFAARYQNGTCVEERMCRLDVAKLHGKGVRRIGMVFNLDKHNQKGSHWVSYYVSMDPARPNFGAYYYDSVAKAPPREVHQLTTRIAAQVVTLVTPRVASRFEKRYNTVRKQFRNSECGVFAMHFLVRMVESKAKFADVCATTGTDADMNAYRNVFYRA